MKESAYNLCARDPDGNYYMYNTRRGSVHVMTAGAYKTYWAAANRASGLEESGETVRDLADKGFLVDNDADELSEILAAHVEAQRSREQLDLIIAPSMACNLDCSYCFESNRYAGRMNEEVQTNIIRLVRRSFESGTNNLHVTWYGGEPLLAFSVIKGLSKRLLALCEEFGGEYSAEIVTNGTLMTREKAQLLGSWNVKRAQITLDGVPELHDERRVPKNRSPTFYRILEGIEAAAAYMQVSIRINVCRNVAARLEELLQILAARGLNMKASVYMAPLQRVRNRKTPSRRETESLSRSVVSPERGAQLDALDSRETADLEFRFHDLLWKYNFAVSDHVPQPRRTTCLADREHSYLIEANGDVQKCFWTAGLGAEAAGHLAADGIDLWSPYQKWQDWTASRSLDCLQCVMLPICLGRCPLKHLKGKSDYCPAVKHNWVRLLARAAGMADGQLVPVHLPLAGEQMSKLRIRSC